MRLFTRGIRPPDEITPNPNDPASVPPSTVGPDQLVTPGDPHGVVTDDSGPTYPPPPVVMPSAWSGWPSEWSIGWGNPVQKVTDTAWMCIDMNCNLLATMPPYLVNPAGYLENTSWLRNPNPDVYTSWEEFAKAAFWDFHLGEVFILCTGRYFDGRVATFHVVPPWYVEVEIDRGVRRYTIGNEDRTEDILHVRYQSRVDDPHGHGPLEAGQAALIAAEVLTRYATTLASSGGIPAGILRFDRAELSEEKSAALQAKWLAARMSSIGEPAVLSGGIQWEPTQVNPTEMALTELLQQFEARVAQLLGVPPFLVGLPSAGDSMTYSNVTSLFNFHWRASLRPKAAFVMAALSEWALPLGTTVEVNRDAYVRPEPMERAQVDQTLNAIQDPQGNPVKTVEQIRAEWRLDQPVPQDLGTGVLK